MTDAHRSETHREVGPTKVERLLETYEQDGLGEELEDRWTRDGDDRDSLRELADVFNRRILEAVLRDAGVEPLAGNVTSIYQHLTDEETDPGTTAELETRLAQQGIDVEEVKAEFVTYQAIRTYLKDVRGATHDPSPTDTRRNGRQQIDRLLGRTTAVVERKLKQLVESDRLTLGSFRVQATVTVYCTDCDQQYDVTALLREGGCDCEAT